MLTRVAESLYWIGRNIERCEHCSRYLKVQYLSTLDAPMSQNKDFTLRSILFMSGSNFDIDAAVNEKEVWQTVIFDYNNPNSIASIVRNARENAKSIRNNLSKETWNNINKLFLFVNQARSQTFNASKIFAFCEDVLALAALIKSTIANTLLHTDIWSFINLGIYVERSFQILRILRSKISDSAILSDNGENLPLMHYQWTTLLKSLESFDVYMNLNRRMLNKSTMFAFLIANPLFPRSIQYAFNKIKSHFENISAKPIGYQEAMQAYDLSIADCIKFNTFEEDEQVIDYINQAFECISNFHFNIEKLYFS